MDKICSMIESLPQTEWGRATKAVVEKFYTQEDLTKPLSDGTSEYPITDEGVNNNWLYENVGSKWIFVNIDGDIKIESPNWVPEGFLIKLYNLCKDEFEDVMITCKWFDESETACGTVVVHQDIYAEDSIDFEYEFIGDPSYSVTGDEELGEVKDWVLEQIGEDSPTTPADVESWDEDELRATFEQWVFDVKWDTISSNWDHMFESCLEAIETEDFEFPITKVKQI